MAAILVTGHRGYLGASIAARLAGAGHAVTGLAGRLEDLRPDSLAPDCVVHAAGALRDADPARIRRSNIEGTRALLAALAPPARIVYVSSRAVYGTSRPPRIVTEEAPAAPDDEYGWSKLEAETLVRASGHPFVILRPALLVGRGEGGAGRSFLSTFVDAARQGLPLRVLGGDQMVDPLFVGDAAGHVAALCGPGPWWGEVFNVAGERARVIDVARRVAARAALGCGRAPSVEVDPGAEPAGVLLDARKLAACSPYRTVTGLGEILDGLFDPRVPPSP